MKCSVCKGELVNTAMGPTCVRPSCPGHRYRDTQPLTTGPLADVESTGRED